jgi:hypothetical protein
MAYIRSLVCMIIISSIGYINQEMFTRILYPRTLCRAGEVVSNERMSIWHDYEPSPVDFISTCSRQRAVEDQDRTIEPRSANGTILYPILDTLI